MNCKKIHKEIIFFLEGDLNQRKKAEVEKHLSGCADCMAFAEDLRLTLGIIQRKKEVAVNPFFYTRLKARMENLSVPVPSPLWDRFFTALRPAFFSLLLMVGIFSGITIGKKSSVFETSHSVSQVEPVPYLNELSVESIESFLME